MRMFLARQYSYYICVIVKNSELYVCARSWSRICTMNYWLILHVYGANGCDEVI